MFANILPKHLLHRWDVDRAAALMRPRCQRTIGVGDGGQGEHVPPPQKKKSKKNILGQLLCKIRAFFGQNHVKFENFVNFSGKYHKNPGISMIFRAKIM